MTPRLSASEIKAIIVSQLETSLSTTVPLLPKSFIRVLAKVLGAVFVLLYGHISFVLLQMFVKTATDEEINLNGTRVKPLSEWGRLVGIERDPGQGAELVCSIQVLTTGGTLNSGTMAINTDSGMLYSLVGDVSLSASTVSGNFRAVDVGIAGNLDAGAELSFISAPADVGKVMTVSSTATVGVELEEVEDFRDRILARWAARPQGGAYADYWEWCIGVTGVKNAYPYSGWDIAGLDNSGSGTVVIFIESKSDAYGIPPIGSTLLDDVLVAIQLNEAGLATRRPINAYTDLTLIRPISRKVVDVTISGLAVEDEAACRAAIEAGLTEFFEDREPYITGLMVPPRKDIVSLAETAGVAARIAASYGGYFASISMEVDSVSTAEYVTLEEGEKARIGAVTW